jgi:hypothetical protein
MTTHKRIRSIKVEVDPGVCGFKCTIKAVKEDVRTVVVTIYGSECRQVQKLSAYLTHMNLSELFLPISRNPVYLAAEKSGCHASCVIPVAVLKAVEVAMEMAVARDVQIKVLATKVTGDKIE